MAEQAGKAHESKISSVLDFKHGLDALTAQANYEGHKAIGTLGQTITEAVGGPEALPNWAGSRFDFGDEQAGKYRVEFAPITVKETSYDDNDEPVFTPITYPRVSVQNEFHGEYHQQFYLVLNRDPGTSFQDYYNDYFLDSELLRNAGRCAAFFDQDIAGLFAGLTEAFELSVPIEATELIEA